MKIKQIYLLLVATVFFGTVSIAQSKSGHKINGYKYLCMENQGNQYDLEDKFNAFFSSIGFIILAEDEEEKLDDNERTYVLYGTYAHNTVQDGLDNTTLTLRDKEGKIVFSSTKESACFISVKNCANKGSDKIINEIKALNYSFDPTLVDKSNKSKSETDTPEDSVKEEKIKLACQMKADGMTTEQIEKYTGLTSEEIDKLNNVEPAEEEKIKLARQMKADGMTTEQIKKYTGLTSEEIDKL